MPQLEITLPSGAKGRIRGLKGREINTFANADAARAGATSLQVLKNAWLETLDVGPAYEGDDLDWSKAILCDRFVALFYIRIATFGSDFTFKRQCGSTRCRRRYEWALNLSEDLDISSLPESSVARFRDNNRFETRITDDDGEKKVVFQLVLPEHEKQMDKVQRLAPKERVTASLAQRIVSVEGLSGRGEIKTWLNDLDAGEMYALLADMDDVDGGVETLIETTCPHCGEVDEVDLPFDQFWSPPKRKRSTRSSKSS